MEIQRGRSASDGNRVSTRDTANATSVTNITGFRNSLSGLKSLIVK
ncbi:MAG: hypothetical protein AMDU1_APLC00014G0040 [Thermoplasmatales archaeon A-plasma]|nr:MAG: hypothetical protein AMDU1_APLC00014G0040 [Thermoplasmatales archaeon A-plasma]